VGGRAAADCAVLLLRRASGERHVAEHRCTKGGIRACNIYKQQRSSAIHLLSSCREAYTPQPAAKGCPSCPGGHGRVQTSCLLDWHKQHHLTQQAADRKIQYVANRRPSRSPSLAMRVALGGKAPCKQEQVGMHCLNAWIEWLALSGREEGCTSDGSTAGRFAQLNALLLLLCCYGAMEEPHSAHTSHSPLPPTCTACHAMLPTKHTPVPSRASAEKSGQVPLLTHHLEGTWVLMRTIRLENVNRLVASLHASLLGKWMQCT